MLHDQQSATYSIAKVLKVEDVSVEIQWLFMGRDFSEKQQREWGFGTKELLMTSQERSRQNVGLETLGPTVRVKEASRSTTLYWWTRFIYFKDDGAHMICCCDGANDPSEDKSGGSVVAKRSSRCLNRSSKRQKRHDAPASPN